MPNVYTKAETDAETIEQIRKTAGSPAATTPTQFTDVPSEFTEAVNWAVANGITLGTSDTTFSPDSICNRAGIITFLYRDMA